MQTCVVRMVLMYWTDDLASRRIRMASQMVCRFVANCEGSLQIGLVNPTRYASRQLTWMSDLKTCKWRRLYPRHCSSALAVGGRTCPFDTPQGRHEEIEMINIGDLFHEDRQIIKKCRRLMIVQNIQIHPMFATIDESI